MFGRFRSSKRTGLTICLTEILRTSSEVRKEKDIPDTVDGMECEIFIAEAPEDVEAWAMPIKNLLHQLFTSCDGVRPT
jgi:hypothetical protein